MMNRPPVTFVLPCDGPAGGVRVTVEMAQRLKNRGYRIRLVYRKSSFPEAVMRCARGVVRWLQRSKDHNWVTRFHGEKRTFADLGQLNFSKGEIVIAVGEWVVPDVFALDREVVKLRYCHAIFEHLGEVTRVAWSVPMATIAVSDSLVPALERYSGSKVLGVVPNGINTEEYHLEEQVRDGLGLIFRRIPAKAPEETIALVQAARQRFPQVPWFIFGTSPRPKEFRGLQYWHYPSVAQARAIYNRCRVWLITSKHEGFCLPVLEAMACGAAVITSNHTAAPDLVRDNVNGFIVPFGNTNAFLEKIDLLLRDEARRRAMVTEGFATANSFTWEEAVGKMEGILAQLS